MAMTSFAKNHNQRLFRNHPGRMSRTLENLSRHGMFVVGDDYSYIALAESEREKKHAAASSIQASTVEVGQSKSTESKARASYRYATQVRDLLLEENDGIMHMSSFAPKHRKRYAFPTIPKKRYGKIKKKLQKLSSLHGLFVVDASSEYIGLSELGKKGKPQQQQAAMTKSAQSEADKPPVALVNSEGMSIYDNDGSSGAIESKAALRHATQVRDLLLEEKGGVMPIQTLYRKHKKLGQHLYKRGIMRKMLRSISLQYDMFEVCGKYIRLSKSEKQKQRLKRIEIERLEKIDKGMSAVDDTRGCNCVSSKEEETEACIQEDVTESALSEADEHPIAAEKTPELSQCVALDSEFDPPRIALVNSEGAPIYDRYYTHGNSEPFFSGVRKAVSRCYTDPVSCVKMLFGTISVERCRSEVAELIQGKVVVGHSLHNDFAALGLSHPEHLLRDTCMHEPLLNAGKKPSLKALAKEQLGVTIQEEGRPHCPAEDAWAAMELYKKHRGDLDAAVLRGVKHRKALASQVTDLIADAGGKVELGAFAEKYIAKTGEKHPFPRRQMKKGLQQLAAETGLFSVVNTGHEGAGVSFLTYNTPALTQAEQSMLGDAAVEISEPKPATEPETKRVTVEQAKSMLENMTAEDALTAIEQYKAKAKPTSAPASAPEPETKDATAEQVKVLLGIGGGAISLDTFSALYEQRYGKKPFASGKQKKKLERLASTSGLFSVVCKTNDKNACFLIDTSYSVEDALAAIEPESKDATAEQVKFLLGSEGGAISLDTFSAVYEQRYGKKPFAKRRRKNLEKLSSTSGLFSVVCKTDNKNVCFLIDG
ncbi:hypothetical protein ACHAXT_007329 [Thalassiosira profunda]